MWNTAAALCIERLAAEPCTKELRDLVYIADTLQDMIAKQEKTANAADIVVVFGDPEIERYAE